MPIYEYECENKKCELAFECQQSIKTNALKKCPSCNQKTLTRLIGIGLGIIIKTNTPTTLGHLAEQNAKKMGKLQNSNSKKTPWWRQSKNGKALPIDFKILKDPKGHIEKAKKI